LTSEKIDPFVVFSMNAELNCHDENSIEACVWKLDDEVAKLKPNVPSNISLRVMRDNLRDFYKPFVGKFKRAAAARKQR
jgi:hypothetical protein